MYCKKVCSIEGYSDVANKILLIRKNFSFFFSFFFFFLVEILLANLILICKFNEIAWYSSKKFSHTELLLVCFYTKSEKIYQLPTTKGKGLKNFWYIAADKGVQIQKTSPILRGGCFSGYSVWRKNNFKFLKLLQ